MFQENLMVKRYGRYAIENEKLPLYADVNIRWKDDWSKKVHKHYIIKLSLEADAKDERIFFYTEGLHGLLALTEEDNGEEFIVTHHNDYFDEIF